MAGHDARLTCEVYPTSERTIQVTCQANDPAVTKQELYNAEYEIGMRMLRIMESLSGAKAESCKVILDHEEAVS